MPACGIQAQRGVETLLKAGPLGQIPWLGFIAMREGSCSDGWDSWGPLQPGLAMPLNFGPGGAVQPSCMHPRTRALSTELGNK